MKYSYLLSKIILSILFIFQFTQLKAQVNFSKDFLVVRLNHKLLDYSKIDDSYIDNVELITFLNESGKIEVSRLNDSILDLGKLETNKLFPNIKTKDSISISRTGAEVVMPPFWATFKIMRPKNIDFNTFQKRLSNVYPVVIYAHPDYYGQPDNIPNDENFGNQLGLYNFLMPNTTINIDSAWNIETGKNYIKVGVFDSGIDSTHEDLDVLTGWGYNNDGFHVWGVDSLGHGTAVAGIIGARRNNSIGIAGIAGGNGSDTSGVRLLDFRLDNTPYGQFSVLGASQGLIDASRYVGTYYDWSESQLGSGPYLENSPGYGLHITNHSYTFRVDASNKSTKDIGGNSGGIGGGEEDISPEHPDCYLCRESYLFSLQNGVINVVARGNRLLAQPSIPEIGYEKYPYSYDDSWVISVGSSGLDGNWLDGQTNNSEFEHYHSFKGRNVDLIAPGTDSLNVTTQSSNVENAVHEYTHFSGSSSAAPHVAGVAALLLSKYNKNCYSNVNLDPADVEYILQKSAVDVNDPSYDSKAGWGRLDAYKALKMIDFPTYQIIHPENEPVNILQMENDTIYFYLNNPLYKFEGGPIGSQFPLQLQKKYRVERRKYELTYDFSDYILDSTKLLDAWVRHSQTNSLTLINDTTSHQVPISPGNPITITEIFQDTFKIEPMAQISLLDTLNHKITLTGYYYHFIGRYFSDFNSALIPENYWYPINPDSVPLKMAYSIYIRDTTLTAIYDFPCTADNDLYDSLASVSNLNNLINEPIEMNLFPNPGKKLNVLLRGQPEEGKLQLFTTTGQLLDQININSYNNSYIFNVENLQEGLYFVNVWNQNGLIISKKWIKL